MSSHLEAVKSLDDEELLELEAVKLQEVEDEEIEEEMDELVENNELKKELRK